MASSVDRSGRARNHPQTRAIRSRRSLPFSGSALILLNSRAGGWHAVFRRVAARRSFQRDCDLVSRRSRRLRSLGTSLPSVAWRAADACRSLVSARRARHFPSRSTFPNGRIDCRRIRVPIPSPERIGLVQPDETRSEWWVTLDGRGVVGFSGDTAQQRAERYFAQLTRIAHAARRHDAQAQPYVLEGDRRRNPVWPAGTPGDRRSPRAARA